MKCPSLDLILSFHVFSCPLIFIIRAVDQGFRPAWGRGTHTIFNGKPTCTAQVALGGSCDLAVPRETGLARNIDHRTMTRCLGPRFVAFSPAEGGL